MDKITKKYLIIGAIPIMIIVLTILIIFLVNYSKREKSSFERYGGPPGRERAEGLSDLIWRVDWASMPPDFHATTASSICAFIEED